MASRVAHPPRRRGSDSESLLQQRCRPSASGLVACGLMLLGTGCTFINAYEDPVLVGKWKSPDPFVAGDSSTKNKMKAELDGDGKATLFFSDGSGNYSADYDLKWEQTDEKEYLIEYDCDSTSFPNGCNGLSFDMDCEADNAGDDLECKCDRVEECPYSADTRWKWERD